MEKDRGLHGMRAGMRQGGVSAFMRAKDKKVINREVKAALARAVELQMAMYPAGHVPELTRTAMAEVIESTLNRLAGDGRITKLLEGRMYAVDPETFGIAVVRDPSYLPPAEET